MRQNQIQNKIRDLYQLDKKIDQNWNLVKKELSKNDVETLERYDTDMINEGLGKSTRLKHIRVLLSISRKLNKEWQNVTKSDIDGLVRNIMKEYGDVNGDETETSRDFKKILKIFFRWYKLGSRHSKSVGDPPETKSIRLKRPKDKITRESLIDENDKAKLLHACGENQRDRAFIDVHLEAGTRPGEILSLQMKHVLFDKYGAKIHVDGKTGARPIRLITSAPNLASWINSHPLRDNPDAPLWILVDKKHYGEPMTYAAAKEMVSRRCVIANIPKRVYLNLFRHTAATKMAKILNEAELKKRQGWTKTSNIPARYVHLVDSDVEEKILGHYGLLDNKKEIDNQLPKICHVCQTPNAFDSKLCSSCGKALDYKTAMEIDDQKDNRISSLEEQMATVIHKLDLMSQTKESVKS